MIFIAGNTVGVPSLITNLGPERTELEVFRELNCGVFVLELSGVRFADVSFRNYLVDWVVYYTAILGITIIFQWVLLSCGCD